MDVPKLEFNLEMRKTENNTVGRWFRIMSGQYYPEYTSSDWGTELARAVVGDDRPNVEYRLTCQRRKED